MIFKHLFTPKWKHPKTEVRLQALNKLEQDKDADVLKTMALEDNSTEIRQKALNKLNSLSLWWQAYKQDQALKDLAEQHISSAVLNGKSELDGTIRQEYVDRYASKRVLEKLAFSESSLEVRVKLLKRLAQPKLIEQSFKQDDEQLQLLLLPLVEQYGLQKQLLKSAKGQAKSSLEQALEQQKLAKEKPAEVLAQVKMILAKLNALRDKHDYKEVNNQFGILTEQWQGLELSWLDQEAVKENQQKYSTIEARISSHLTALKTEFEAAEKAEQAKREKAVFLTEVESQLNLAEQALVNALEQLDVSKQADLETQLSQVRSKITSSEHSVELVKHLDTLADFESQLKQLPELVVANQAAQTALDALANVTPSTELSELDDTLNSQKSAYNNAKGIIEQLPNTLKKPAKAKLSALSKQFKAAMAEQLDAQQNELKQARRKAKDVQRLVEQGRSKVAFGVFKGFNEHYERLTTANQAQLEPLREQISAQLDDIRDWQKYASAPKRVELLAVLDEHIESCDLAPKQRAELVKKLRVQWHELGRIDTDEEKSQAKQFDEKLEVLFAPCREFFAEQEQQREQAKHAREDLISEITKLAEIDTSLEGFNWREFESQFNKLNKQWRAAGSVDSDIYKSLNSAFKVQAKCIGDAIRTQHELNAQLKQALVNTAAEQVESEDLAQACDVLKSLQKQWQKIGFAGNKKENQLWQAFREHNDKVFAKRSAEFESQKAEKDTLNSEQQKQFDEIKSQLSENGSEAEIKKLISQLSEIDFLPAVKKQAQKFITELQQKLVELEQLANAARFDALKVALKDGSMIPAEFISKTDVDLSSEQLILRLELLSDKVNDESTTPERMAEQVAMLDDKLQGQNVDFDCYLSAYLSNTPSAELQSERLLKLL
ncbi:DUF349 domain-containing protein [Pseudoalteromonas phenolica]|uniref:DUF349 domain-containing protein n=1 Tax=Pseudoalteromonas phenolica TaxID=161398 RepID=A0A0S2K1I8_9GAMM|nr:DUF349 domain-containing protein [Pseudoalteromonas phenolica]ALO42375.1 hypothetical protein PP2015_1874 [Pseudoalteromonas phenolica]MBE0356529.1 hypothetical protein [Pseudoalteromonas phenolica O-BC30]